MRNSFVLFLTAIAVMAQEAPPPGPPQQKKGMRPQRPPLPGVKEVQKPMTEITPDAVFPVPGVPDWTTAAPDGIWVSNKPKGTVSKLNAKTNIVEETIEVGKAPCSGIAFGFGSIWAPTCGDRNRERPTDFTNSGVARVDIKTNKLVAFIDAPPANSEGGIAVSPEAVWIASGAEGDKVLRINPTTNKVEKEIAIVSGSHTVDYGEGAVWVTQSSGNILTRIDPKTNTVTDKIEVGPKPRFLTVGEGFVWTLNQGDGTVSKVDPKTKKVVATIQCGVPGGGGEISAGGGAVWLTVFQIPLTRIDAKTDKVTHQWAGAGGDAVLFAHGSVWLSNLREQNIWRLDPAKLLK